MVRQKDTKKQIENKLKFSLRSFIVYNMKDLSPNKKPWAMEFQTLLKELSLDELEHARTCFEKIDDDLKNGKITVAELTETKYKMAQELQQWKSGHREKPTWFTDK